MVDKKGIDPELYRTIVAIVDERMKEIKVTREDFNELKAVVERLAKAQERTEIRVEKLAKAQERMQEAQERMQEAQERMQEAQERMQKVVERTQKEVGFLARQVGGLSDRIGFGLEEIARGMLPPWLEKHYGVKVDALYPAFFKLNGKRIEINLYGEGEKGKKEVAILGETKSRIGKRVVDRFVSLTDKIIPQISREVYRVIFGFVILPDGEERAKISNIILCAPYLAKR